MKGNQNYHYKLLKGFTEKSRKIQGGIHIISPKSGSRLKKSAKKTLNTINQSIPLLLGVISAISLLNAAVPEGAYSKIFSGNIFLDPLLGGIIGSVAAGNPITSYVVGGELLSEGVSLIAVTAFLLTWVTVGLIHLPAEIDLLGKKFALARNLICFIVSVPVAVLVVITVEIIGVLF